MEEKEPRRRGCSKKVRKKEEDEGLEEKRKKNYGLFHSANIFKILADILKISADISARPIFSIYRLRWSDILEIFSCPIPIPVSHQNIRPIPVHIGQYGPGQKVRTDTSPYWLI